MDAQTLACFNVADYMRHSAASASALSQLQVRS